MLAGISTGEWVPHRPIIKDQATAVLLEADRDLQQARVVDPRRRPAAKVDFDRRNVAIRQQPEQKDTDRDNRIVEYLCTRGATRNCSIAKRVFRAFRCR